VIDEIVELFDLSLILQKLNIIVTKEDMKSF